MTISTPTTLRRFGIAAAASVSTLGLLAGPANAATTNSMPQALPAPTEAARFCFQLATSQQAMAKIASTDANRSAKLAAEWETIAKATAGTLKADVTAVAKAYRSAVGQPKSSADATLKAITENAKRISAYSKTNCQAPSGGRPNVGQPNAASIEKLQTCLKKKGVTLPGGIGQPGGANGVPPEGVNGAAPGRAKGGAPQLDAKGLAAIQACAKETGLSVPSGG